MLIRTQDKNVLVNVDNLVTIEVAEPLQAGIFIVGYINTEKTTVNLGRYSSKDKARKVLDLIEDAYKRDKAIIHHRTTEYLSNKIIFQMPQDYEVET